MGRKRKGEKRRSSRVYFIHSEEQNAIKIGHSNKPNKRLDFLQTGNPAELAMLGSIPGGRKLEQRWHRQWDAFRIRGEWFRAHESLMRAIMQTLAISNELRTVGDELVRRQQCRSALIGVTVALANHPGEVYAIESSFWGAGDDEPLRLVLLPVEMFRQRQEERLARTNFSPGPRPAAIADLIREMDADPLNDFRFDASANDCVLMSRWPVRCTCWMEQP